MKGWGAVLFCAVCATVLGAAAQGAEVKELKVGDPVPDVTTTDESGKEVKLSSFKDKEGLVIFFFPKAFTGG
jgi:peroxiredoxin